MKTTFTLLLITLLTHAGAQLTNTRNWKTQTDLQFFSSLRYPPDWKVEEMKSDGYVIRSPRESDTDHYQENVSLFAAEASEELMKKDVRSFAEANFIEMKKNMQDTRVMANKYANLNGVPVYFVMYNGVFKGQYLYCKQFYCLYKNVAYILTYTGEAGRKDTYAIIGGDILSSFSPANIKQD